MKFGAKISVSLTGDKLAHVDKLHWDACHAGHDLQGQVEAYKKRYGYYPEAVIADRLYGSRDNRSYLEKHNIRFSGKPLGRPPKATTENQGELKQLKAQRRQEYRGRIPIEGKFGQGKRLPPQQYPGQTCRYVDCLDKCHLSSHEPAGTDAGFSAT